MRLITLSGFNHLINRVFLSLFVLLLLFCHIDSYATNRQFLVAYAQDTMANDWRAAQVKQLEQAFSKYPEIKFIYTDAGGSTAKQIQDIEDLVYQKVDLLITSPRDGKLMTPVISRIYKSGLPVVLITRNIQRNDYTSFVAPDDDEIARKAARYIAKQLNGKGRIVMLRGCQQQPQLLHEPEVLSTRLKNIQV